jgi:hypothetical protein
MTIQPPILQQPLQNWPSLAILLIWMALFLGCLPTQRLHLRTELVDDLLQVLYARQLLLHGRRQLTSYLIRGHPTTRIRGDRNRAREPSDWASMRLPQPPSIPLRDAPTLQPERIVDGHSSIQTTERYLGSEQVLPHSWCKGKGLLR